MPPLSRILALVVALASTQLQAALNYDPYTLTWTSPSLDSSGSVPLGNGDIALNAWVEPSGELVFYVAKTDAVSENSQFLKLGRVRVSLSPSPLVAGAAFRQDLSLKDGALLVTVGSGETATTLRLWVDANRPVVRLEVNSAQPVAARASLEVWRNQARPVPDAEKSTLREIDHSPEPLVIDPDTVLPNRDGSLIWYHRNTRSTYPLVLRTLQLGSLLEKHPDPLLNRTFGGLLRGPGFTPVDDRTLAAPAALHHELSLHALTAQTATPEHWVTNLQARANQADAAPLNVAWTAHTAWWRAFFERSFIHISEGRDAEGVTRAYALQRWMMACAGRGALPVKFNGGLFTVDATLNNTRTGSQTRVDADYRAWGSNYWFQNTRLLYWPLLASGDYDLLDPLFRMYKNALPLALDRTRLMYQHGGAAFHETLYFWGTTNPNDFGWKHPGPDTANPYIRHYWCGNLELITLLLTRYDHSADAAFAGELLLPLADAITTFYDEHWKRDAAGKIHFSPAQALETFHQAVNPSADIAGLMNILPRLLALPEALTNAPQRARWTRMLAELPPLPFAQEGGGRRLLPAQSYSVKKNTENTELYALFPFRVFGLGRPDLDTALRTHAARFELDRTCWSQEGIHAALLGLSGPARANVVANFIWANDRAQRFPAFWRHGYDWTPDLDNGGSAALALQAMLIQDTADQLILAPAWPDDWTVDFKLHAPGPSVVTGRIEKGRVTTWDITPASRRSTVRLGPLAP